MRISEMPVSLELIGNEVIPILDTTQSDKTLQNRRISVNLFRGVRGDNGFPGLSTYKLWLNHGNRGTELDFLKASLGVPGASGLNGENGLSSYDLWLQEGNTDTKANYLASLNGKSVYDTWLELGNIGEESDFINYLRGFQGYSAYENWLQLGNSGTYDEFMNSLKGIVGGIWHKGSAVPSSSLGLNGDLYLRDSTGDIYSKSNSVWSGPQGNVQGTNGTRGSVWYTSTASPADTIGANDDHHLNTSNGNVYKRVNGTWGSPIANIRGPQGPQGLQGVPGANASSTDSGFGTGDIKYTSRLLADPGFIMLNDGTIGNTGSGASTLADPSSLNLYSHLWNNYSQTLCPVTGGRGSSSLSDFESGKPLRLPLFVGRIIGISGAGQGLTSRTGGVTVGEESVSLLEEQGPKHFHRMRGPNSVSPPNINFGASYSFGNYGGGTADDPAQDYATFSTGGTGGSSTTSANNATSGVGAGAPHNNMQPTTFMQAMIKL